jgi:hypothetical protein
MVTVLVEAVELMWAMGLMMLMMLMMQPTGMVPLDPD